MIPIVGEILPMAVGVAISPLTIIAAVVMLLSPRAKSMSVALLIGWIIGIFATITAFMVLASTIPAGDADAPSLASGVLKLVLGVLLLLVATRQWRRRPTSGQQAVLPAWMAAAIDSLTPAKGLVLGVLLAAASPKNLLLAASAGLLVGSAELTGAENTVVVIAFTALAGCTVFIPVLGYLFASSRVLEPLERSREWLVSNNTAITAVLVLVLGVLMIGKGLAVL